MNFLIILSILILFIVSIVIGRKIAPYFNSSDRPGGDVSQESSFISQLKMRNSILSLEKMLPVAVFIGLYYWLMYWLLPSELVATLESLVPSFREILLVLLLILALVFRGSVTKFKSSTARASGNRTFVMIAILVAAFVLIQYYMQTSGMEDEVTAFWGSDENAFWLILTFFFLVLPSFGVFKKQYRGVSLTLIAIWGMTYFFIHEDGKNYSQALKHGCGDLSKTGFLREQYLEWRRVTLEPGVHQDYIAPIAKRGKTKGMVPNLELEPCGPLQGTLVVETWDMEGNKTDHEISDKPSDARPSDTVYTFTNVREYRFKSDDTLIFKVRTRTPL